MFFCENSLDILNENDNFNKCVYTSKKGKILQRKRYFPYRTVILVLFFLLSSNNLNVIAKTQSASNSNTSNLSSFKKNGNPGILEIYEKENYDAELSTWYGDENRWTTSSGSASDPPTSLHPPPQFKFASNWKIDVTGKGKKDKDGWEYFLGGKRRRRWLRNLTPITDISSKSIDSKLITNDRINEDRELSLELNRSPGAHQLIPQRIINIIPKSILTPLVNNFNFKGFGVSILKSVIFPTSFGGILSLPLTSNFNFFETRPHIPRLSTSAGFFGSNDNFTVVSFLSLSMSMEVVRFCLLKIVKFFYLIYWLIWKNMIMGSIHFLSSIFLLLSSSSPSKEKEKNTKKHATISSILSCPSIQHSFNYQERISCSFSWRVSIQRGYEFRISYSYLYLPTLDYLFLRNRNGGLSNWFKEKTGSVGLSTSYPMPDFPNFSCTSKLECSGFYPRNILSLKKKIRIKEVNEETLDSRNERNLNKDVASPIVMNKDLSKKKLTKKVDMEESNREIEADSSSSGGKEAILGQENKDESKTLISSSFGWGNNDG